MTVRSLAAAVQHKVTDLVRRLAPEPQEDALYLGNALIAAGFLVAGQAALALLVPGTVMVIAGLVFNHATIRRVS